MNTCRPMPRPIFIRAYSTSLACTKFYPITPTSSTLRHLHFTEPLAYGRAQLIQSQFSGAFLQFKQMASKISWKQRELAAQNLTTNDYETQLLKGILQMKPCPTLLSFEMRPVFTAGRREKGKLTDDDISRLESYTSGQEGSYQFVQTNRGGEITFHNPGQLVVYPILDLQDFHHLTIKCFVSHLENSIINTLDKFGVRGVKTENTGVWINDHVKISSIGLNVSRSVTSHGISINVNNEIPGIKQIGFNFCGLQGKTQTTICQQVGHKVEVKDVASEFSRQFAKGLGIERVESVDLPDLEIE